MSRLYKSTVGKVLALLLLVVLVLVAVAFINGKDTTIQPKTINTPKVTIPNLRDGK